MENPTNFVLRRPFYGVVPARSQVAFVVSPPMSPQETLMCAATRANSEVVFSSPRPDAIVVQNRSATPVAFGVMVIPSVIGPSESVWQTLLAKIQSWTNRLRS